MVVGLRFRVVQGLGFRPVIEELVGLGLGLGCRVQGESFPN